MTTHKNRHEVIAKEGKLVIHKTNEEDAGNYACELDGETYTFEVWGKKKLI